MRGQVITTSTWVEYKAETSSYNWLALVSGSGTTPPLLYIFLSKLISSPISIIPPCLINPHKETSTLIPTFQPHFPQANYCHKDKIIISPTGRIHMYCPIPDVHVLSSSRMH